jgi:hypothetical protein
MKGYTEEHQQWNKLRYLVERVAKRSEWRVLPYMDWEDLVSEGYLLFRKCRDRYSDKKPAHFRNLLMKSFRNRIATLAQRRTVSRVDTSLDQPILDEEGEGCTVADLLPKDYGEYDKLFLCLMVEEAPIEVRCLAYRLLFGLQPHIRSTDGTRETNWQRVDRLSSFVWKRWHTSRSIETDNQLFGRILGVSSLFRDIVGTVHEWARSELGYPSS